jgi:hypothetical protein
MRTLERRGPGQRCPYCHDDVARTSAAVACTTCFSVHHRDCFAERGSCSIFGCAGEKTREVAVGGVVRAVLRASRERARHYEKSIPFSLALLVLCLSASGGLLFALLTGKLVGLVLCVALFVLVPLLYFASSALGIVAAIIQGWTTDELTVP